MGNGMRRGSVPVNSSSGITDSQPVATRFNSHSSSFCRIMYLQRQRHSDCDNVSPARRGAYERHKKAEHRTHRRILLRVVTSHLRPVSCNPSPGTLRSPGRHSHPQRRSHAVAQIPPIAADPRSVLRRQRRRYSDGLDLYFALLVSYLPSTLPCDQGFLHSQRLRISGTSIGTGPCPGASLRIVRAHKYAMGVLPSGSF